MAKPKRGSNARVVTGWRGTCPACDRQRVKLLWVKTDEGGKTLKVCKWCGT